MGGEPGVKFHPIFVELFVHPTEITGDFEAKTHLAQLAKTTCGCMGEGGRVQPVGLLSFRPEVPEKRLFKKQSQLKILSRSDAEIRYLDVPGS